MAVWSSAVVLLILAAQCLAQDEVTKDITVLRMARELDLASQLVKQKVTITFQNSGTKPVASFLYTVDPALAGKLSYVGAQLENAEEKLKVVQTSLAGKPDLLVYKVSLTQPLTSEQSTTVVVETVFTHAIFPFPKEITQNERQLVQFTGNAYIISPYPCKTQSTTVHLPSSSVESFTRVAPANVNDKDIVYGPYGDVAPFSNAKIIVHFENNGPFVGAVSLLRLIEVSHWGNIAVEEHLHVKHQGATLKGSFARYDFQRNPNSGQSSVKSYSTILPASAKDVYYRDEIGNISTSHLREGDDAVELELRPRFPLFGGWQTRYYIGYNVPTYEYLYHSGSHYVLKMRFVDHIFDDQVIDDAKLKVILPEGAKNIVLKAPYSVQEQPREVLHTYLDTVGRPVVVATKSNLVEQHIVDFELHYDFEVFLLLQEPLLVVFVLYLFFLFVVVLVRLDFAIRKDSAVLTKQQASVLIDGITSAVDKRSGLCADYQEAIATYKSSKDPKAFNNKRKALGDKYQAFTEEVGSRAKDLHALDAEASAKANDLQKKAAEVKTLLESNCQLADSLVGDKMDKKDYIKVEKENQAKLTRLQSEIDSIIPTL
ncbi:hypothetical protein EMCRGX_G027071 [Ephydatia muelleri]